MYSSLPLSLLCVADREQQELIKAARTIQTAFRKYTVSATRIHTHHTCTHPHPHTKLCAYPCLCKEAGLMRQRRSICLGVDNVHSLAWLCEVQCILPCN